MTVRLEHANLIVRDIDATIRFLQAAFPEFRIRFDGKDLRGRRWVHIGTNDSYIALTQSTVEPEERWKPYVGLPGVNHLAYEVDDVEALRDRLRSAGYQTRRFRTTTPIAGASTSTTPMVTIGSLSSTYQTILRSGTITRYATSDIEHTA